jgi:cyanate lyase
MSDRKQVTAKILEAKASKQLTFAEIAAKVGRSEVWTASALLGQATMSAEEAQAAVAALGLGEDVLAGLRSIPMKGSLEGPVPVDPLIYRFHEINQVYGTTIKALIHEKFGDGIMSAIDFEMKIEKLQDPKGDRVLVTLNGKFLPYRKW